MRDLWKNNGLHFVLCCRRGNWFTVWPKLVFSQFKQLGGKLGMNLLNPPCHSKILPNGPAPFLSAKPPALNCSALALSIVLGYQYFQEAGPMYLGLPISRWGLEFWNCSWFPDDGHQFPYRKWQLKRHIPAEFPLLSKLCLPRQCPPPNLQDFSMLGLATIHTQSSTWFFEIQKLVRGYSWLLSNISPKEVALFSYPVFVSFPFL